MLQLNYSGMELRAWEDFRCHDKSFVTSFFQSFIDTLFQENTLAGILGLRLTLKFNRILPSVAFCDSWWGKIEKKLRIEIISFCFRFEKTNTSKSSAAAIHENQISVVLDRKTESEMFRVAIYNKLLWKQMWQ